MKDEIKKQIREESLTKELLMSKYGFFELTHYSVMNSLMKSVGRNRFLSVGCIGTPNEMLFIQDIEDENIIGQVVLWNYDYDGQLTEQCLAGFISLLTQTKPLRSDREKKLEEALTMFLDIYHMGDNAMITEEDACDYAVTLLNEMK